MVIFYQSYPFIFGSGIFNLLFAMAYPRLHHSDFLESIIVNPYLALQTAKRTMLFFYN